jgi:hypothetical protein
VVRVSVAEKQTVNWRPIAVKKPRHSRREWASGQIGLQRQSRIEHDAGRAGGYLNASAPYLMSAPMDSDTHA